MKLAFIRKKKKFFFQVKTISKDVRKTIVPSFMFHFNSFEVCCPWHVHHWTNEIKYKHTWFSRKIFVFYRKWKIKSTVVLDMRSDSHLEDFLIKQGVLFFCRSLMFEVCVEVCTCDHMPHMLKPGLRWI